MTFSIRVGLGQLNPTVGDISGNADKILTVAREAVQRRCDLALFPELALTGYPPEDLIFKPSFLKDNIAALKRLASQVKGLTAVVGFIDVQKGKRFNAAAWIQGGKIKTIYHKVCLPNYGVFDENRYFEPGRQPFVGLIKGARIGVTICEDIWVPGAHLAALRSKKPDMIVNISASPFHVGKLAERQNAFRKNLRPLGVPFLYCNTVGGQDELVFDGGSFGLHPNGRVAAQCPLFESGLYIADISTEKKRASLHPLWPAPERLSKIEEIHSALLVGIRDYVGKNGFKTVALGVSGGIDSAVVAALAAEALGPENVVCVTMPTHYNLSETKDDAARLAKNLKARFIEIPIQSLFQEFLKTLKPVFGDLPPNVAEENIQARIRGNLLMAMSNKFNWLILTTGNKSELSTGYCTLYGDTAGGFSVLKDVLKTSVFGLARHINAKAGKEVIPESTITRPPTAELRENQKDEDVLGAYKDLDPIITGYVEQNLTAQDLLRRMPGKGPYIRKILSIIDRNEYKRRQAPLGIKITPRSFGRDHRMPITNRYKPS